MKIKDVNILQHNHLLSDIPGIFDEQHCMMMNCATAFAHSASVKTFAHADQVCMDFSTSIFSTGFGKHWICGIGTFSRAPPRAGWHLSSAFGSRQCILGTLMDTEKHDQDEGKGDGCANII